MWRQFVLNGNANGFQRSLQYFGNKVPRSRFFSRSVKMQNVKSFHETFHVLEVFQRMLPLLPSSLSVFFLTFVTTLTLVTIKALYISEHNMSIKCQIDARSCSYAQHRNCYRLESSQTKKSCLVFLLLPR